MQLAKGNLITKMSKNEDVCKNCFRITGKCYRDRVKFLPEKREVT